MCSLKYFAIFNSALQVLSPASSGRVVIDGGFPKILIICVAA